MGWCSGTKVFDSMVTSILDNIADTGKQRKLIKDLTETLENMDWDCQYDSEYANHPIVKDVWRKLHPDWEEVK